LRNVRIIRQTAPATKIGSSEPMPPIRLGATRSQT
jgi:hypothetical protein